MDQAIAATDLGAGRGSWWHPVLDVLQWLALLTAVVGAGWLGVLALAGYLQFPLPPAPTVEGFPLPTLLLVGGLALGVIETFGAAYISVPYKDGFAFLVLIAFLVFRPQGIFGERVAEKA